MVKKEIKDGIIHFYSDAGLPIKQKRNKILFMEAYERVDNAHEWEEVKPEKDS